MAGNVVYNERTGNMKDFGEIIRLDRAERALFGGPNDYIEKTTVDVDMALGVLTTERTRMYATIAAACPNVDVAWAAKLRTELACKQECFITVAMAVLSSLLEQDYGIPQHPAKEV